MSDHVYKIVVHTKLDDKNSPVISEINQHMNEFGFDEKILVRSHYTHAYISSERELTPDEIAILTRELNKNYLASEKLRHIDRVEVIPANAAETAAFLASDKREAIS